jgi:hypothetical protein
MISMKKRYKGALVASTKLWTIKPTIYINQKPLGKFISLSSGSFTNKMVVLGI